jgi:hypothetical protein
MIVIDAKGINIGNAMFEVIPRNFCYARGDKYESTAWDFGVKDNQTTEKFRIAWEKEFNKFRLILCGIDLYIILTEEWINRLRSLPDNYAWVSDIPLDMAAYPDGKVIDISQIRKDTRKEVLDSLQKFIDHDGCYPDCDLCTAQDDQ